MATTTVSPEMSTERPDVAAAAAIASRGGAAAASLFTLSAKVEQRVVDADRHADEQHHRGPPSGWCG